MEAQINDNERDLSDVDHVSILQTEDGNPSDIRINYSNDVSNVGIIIYDQNLHNDGANQANPSWKKRLVNIYIYYFYILYRLLYIIIIIIILWCGY